MAKKNNTKGTEANLEWTDETTLVGIPTIAFLPPKNFYFKVLEDKHKITIPKSGAYKDLDSDFFNKKDGDFVILNDDASVCYLSTITKVLFALNKYPELEHNQLFCPLALVFNDNSIDIFGQIICMLQPPQGMTVDDEY